MNEQIYNDFTTKLLPKIQEGLTITKEYFLDLFGRYVKYLIISDSIYLGIFTVLFIASIYFIRKAVKSQDVDRYEVWEDWRIVMCVIGIIVLIISSVGVIDSLSNLIKDFYIPEVRVLEQIKGYNN